MPDELERVGPEPETFGASPEDIARVKAILSYVESGGKYLGHELISHIGGSGEGTIFKENPGEAPTLDPTPYEAFKQLASPEHQYRVGAEDTRGVALAGEVGKAAMVGSMPFPRPAGSISIFLGPREAAELERQGRPAAQEALAMANRMEAQGETRHGVIRKMAHDIFKKYKESTFGTIFKPDYEGAPWMFEVATNKDKLSRPKAGTLGQQYANPDLSAAMPGIEDIAVKPIDVSMPGQRGEGYGRAYHEPGELGTTAPPLVPGVPSEIGVAGPKMGGRTMADVHDDVIRELQNEVFYRGDMPRGGRAQEFEPGGGLESEMLPGESSVSAYRRLKGVELARAAAARSKLSPTQLRKTPVEETIREQRDRRTGPSIVKYYEGQRIRTHAEDESPLGRLAQRVAQGARQTAADMKAAGASPEEIAARLTKEYGSPVTAEDVSSGRAWWNEASEPSRGIRTYRPFWTTEQKQLFLRMHREGVPYDEMAKELQQAGRPDVTPGSLQDLAHNLGVAGKGRGGDRRSKEARKAGIRRANKSDDET